jgi:hypothetical protein
VTYDLFQFSRLESRVVGIGINNLSKPLSTSRQVNTLLLSHVHIICVCWLMHCTLRIWDCSGSDKVWNWQTHNILVSKHCVKLYYDLVRLHINHLFKLLSDSNNALTCLEVNNGFDRLLIPISITRDSPVERNWNKSYVTISPIAWSGVFHCITTIFLLCITLWNDRKV